MEHTRKLHTWGGFLLLLVLLVTFLIWNLLAGSVRLPASEIWAILHGGGDLTQRRILHFLHKKLIAQHERALAGILFPHDRRGRFAGGENLVSIDLQPHFLELFHVEPRVMAGIVGQKQEITAGFQHAFDERKRAVDQLAAQIERAVHVQQKALYIAQSFHQAFSPSLSANSTKPSPMFTISARLFTL